MGVFWLLGVGDVGGSDEATVVVDVIPRIVCCPGVEGLVVDDVTNCIGPPDVGDMQDAMPAHSDAVKAHSL